MEKTTVRYALASRTPSKCAKLPRDACVADPDCSYVKAGKTKLGLDRAATCRIKRNVQSPQSLQKSFVGPNANLNARAHLNNLERKVGWSPSVFTSRRELVNGKKKTVRVPLSPQQRTYNYDLKKSWFGGGEAKRPASPNTVVAGAIADVVGLVASKAGAERKTAMQQALRSGAPPLAVAAANITRLSQEEKAALADSLNTVAEALGAGPMVAENASTGELKAAATQLEEVLESKEEAGPRVSATKRPRTQSTGSPRGSNRPRRAPEEPEERAMVVHEEGENPYDDWY